MIFLVLALYTGEERAARLQVLLEAAQRTPVELLMQAHQHVLMVERGACAVGNQRLRADCLIAAARKSCETQANVADCSAYHDVIVSNVLAEQQWVPPARRYEIMKQTKDWRGEVTREIRRMQAVLAANLRLQTRGSLETTAGLARAIDAFCASNAFETGLSWQICASSLVWFVGAREAK